jgi:hypothetical protein
MGAEAPTTRPVTHNAPAPGTTRAEPRRTAVRDRWPLLILLAPLVLVCAGFWPGHMSSDTLGQIGQVMSFDLTNQHSPLLVAVWKPFFELGAGPGWVLTLQVAAFLAGAYLALRAVFGRVAAALITSVVALWPAVFGMLGYLSRDTWFASLLVLSFGLTVRAAQSSGRFRPWWIVAAFAAAWLTLAARQNAAPAVALAVVVLAALLPLGLLHRGGAVRRLAAAVVVGVVLTAGLMATQVGASAALGVRDVAPEQYLYIYDLGNLSVRDHVNHFPRDVMPAARRFHQLALRVSPESVVALVWAPDAPIKGTPLHENRLHSLADAWRDQVRDGPLEWLDVRWDLMMRNLAVTEPANWIYHPQIDPNHWGYKPTFAGANEAAKDYVEAFSTEGPALKGGIVHRVWIYLLVALAAALVLFRVGRSSLPLGLTALTYQVGLFLGTPQNAFRLEFPVVLVGLLCLAAAVGALLSRRAQTVP